MGMSRSKTPRKPTLGYSLFVLVGILAIVLGGNILLNAPIAPMFFFVWLFVVPAIMHLGYTYSEVNTAMMESIKNGFGAVLIVMSVGGLISTWIAAGTVPTIIFYGLKFINPQFFLLSAFILCGMVSLACGTSWGTLGTAGIAMYAVGVSLGIPPGMTLGAIISGSYLGDMLSPMSDSTNVASAATGVDLIYHCKKLVIIVSPVVVLTGIIYFIIGTQYAVESFDNSFILDIIHSIENKFTTGFLAFLPLIVLLAMLILKLPALLSMLTSALVGAVIAVLYQGLPHTGMISVFWNGYVSDSGHEFIDTLLNRGGVQSMFSSACMMIFAFGMIGAFNKAEILETIISPITRKVKTPVQLTAVSQIICIIANTMGTNTFSLLMTGSLMTPAYKKMGMHPSNLGKALNSTSTIICPMIPWNASGIVVYGMFGLSTLTWAPYALFSYIMPIAALAFVALKFQVTPLDDQPAPVKADALQSKEA